MNEREIRQEIARGFEYSYVHDDWITPLDEALNGLSAEDAGWTPRPEIPSIWAIVLHLDAWNRNIVDRIAIAEAVHPAEDWPSLPSTLDEPGWERAKAELRAALASVQSMIADTPLDTIQAAPYALADLLCRLTHNGYHLGQITKLREWRGA
jgi:hypothetical protein